MLGDKSVHVIKKKVNRSAALFLVFLVLLIISMESKLFWLSF